MENSDDLFRFITALRAYTSYDLSDYSDRSLRRRLYKVLDDQRITIDELLAQLAKDPSYGEQLVEAILPSGFFCVRAFIPNSRRKHISMFGMLAVLWGRRSIQT